MFKLLKITCFLSVISLQLFSQLQVKNFYSLTGRKNISVNVITQDFSGYLLLGTNEGLFKFDGRSSQQLLKEQASLKTEISALYVDSKETIWVGTKSGKVFTLAKNKIDSLVFPKENEERITSFYESGKTINIGTYGNGLYTFNEGKINHYTSEQGLSDNVIYKITGNDKQIWCGTDGGITEITDGSRGLIFNTISHKNGLPDNIVRDLNFIDGQLIVSMQDSGVCYYNRDSKRFAKIPFFSNWSLGAVLSTNQINHNELVIGTEKNGLIHMRKGVIYIYDYPEYIKENTINQVFIDREKQIWLCSKKGISQFTEKRYSIINTQSGLMETKVLAVAVDNDNSVWIGTSMGISRITNDDRGKTIIVKVKDLDKYIISCATKAPDGSIWFGTYGYGIVVIDSKTKKELSFTAEKNKLSNDNISNLYFSNENTLFISTLGGGLIKANVNPESKDILTIEKTFMQEEGLGSNYVYSAITDKDGVLYVGTDGGGLQVLKNGKFIDLTKKFRKISNTVFSLCLDDNNNIWASSNADGILKYDGKFLSSINTFNGLREEQPQQIISAEGTVFAFNSKGIDKINCKDNTVTYYDISEGESEPNLNAVAAFNNKIYSGSNNGVLVFRTDKQASDSIKPLVFIKGLSLNYKPFPMDSTYEFKYNQNNFSFSFDANWLKNPTKLLFRYRLNGLEDNWLYASEGKDINYNNLNPGNYTFIVQVKNEEEIWSDPTGYSFIIRTPIWKRLWFWI
ncbi:MAG: hypothetical protein JNL60_08900, partial [Bacteroidia bacterium]|nr:hypothetical protein [Bacteroidia bacterium]